jgi:membrane-associated phospholipid phosphatase
MDANSRVLVAPLFGRRPLTASPARSLFAAAALFCLAGLAMLSIDLPASKFLRSRPAGDGAVKLLTISETFSHGVGVALILLAAAVLDRPSRRRLPRAAAIAYGAGLFANLGKLCLARWRPKSYSGGGSVWETFGDWLPWVASGGDGWGRQLQSFPSAHAAIGCGLAIALSWLYPRGRWLFAGFALLGALQRLDAGAHYPSDVCFGAAIGCLAGAVLLGENRLSRIFTRWENATGRRAAG